MKKEKRVQNDGKQGAVHSQSQTVRDRMAQEALRNHWQDLVAEEVKFTRGEWIALQMESARRGRSVENFLRLAANDAIMYFKESDARYEAMKQKREQEKTGAAAKNRKA